MAQKKKKKRVNNKTWDIKTAPKSELITCRILLIILGLLSLALGLVFYIVLPLAILSFYLAHVYKKELKRRKNEPVKEIEPVEVVKPEIEPIEKIEPVKVEEKPEPITEERFNELKQMCKDIHEEYKSLLKRYKDSDIEGKEYILSECYRKLEVIESTVIKHKCYDEIDIYDEYEKIEKKARSFINTYIKEERESGIDDDMIDVTQFSINLNFISDYIWEKDEKLNKR